MTVDLLEENTVVHNFFAGSANYVSNATVHISDGIKLFFYSNIDHDLL